MQWTDNAIILSTSKYSEHAAIVSLFAREHGIYRTMAKQALTKAQRGIYQAGNIVSVSWNARLEEHMGHIKAELMTPVAAHAMQESSLLYALGSLCRLVELCFEERDPHPELYDMMQHTLLAMVRDKNWLGHYAAFEKQLLIDSGYQLDLSECTATGEVDDLIYVSPKSGRAVSKIAGEPYKDKLLPLPERFDEMDIMPEDNTDQHNSLAITGYFLEKWVLEPHGKTLPNTRAKMLGKLVSS